MKKAIDLIHKKSTKLPHSFDMPSQLLDALNADHRHHKSLFGKAVNEESTALNLLLSRTSFGVSQNDLALASDMGFDDYLNLQLNPDQIDTDSLDETIRQFFPDLFDSYQELFAQAQQDPTFRPGIQLIVATLIRAMFSPAQLYEVMVEFWSNHFSVNMTDGLIDLLKPVDDRENIRPLALSSFKELLHANAKSPAMLIYLDGFTNSVNGPNENYARELMELHTLGVDGGYTEEDVKEVARCFTGWTLNPEVNGLFVFSGFDHDYEEKTVLGQTIPAGGGQSDGEAVLDLLASHPATARMIGYKLCKRFIADEPDPAVIDQVANTYLETDGDIKAMLNVLFQSNAFAESSQMKFKRPFEYVVSLLRTLQPILANNSFRLLFDQLLSMKQVPFYYPAPTGYPDSTSAWLNTNALLNYWNLGLSLAFGESSQATFTAVNNQIPQVSILKIIGDARTAAAITDAVINYVLPHGFDREDRNELIEYAAKDWPSTSPLPLDLAADRGRAVLSAVLVSPQFQYR